MPRSTYSKIHQILLVSDETGPTESSNLAQVIQGRKLDAFAIFRRNDTGKVIKSWASTASIARNMKLARDFQLLVMEEGTSKVRLTERGQNALKGDLFRRVLGQAVIDFLDANKGTYGFDFDDIRRVIEAEAAPSRQDIQMKLNIVGMSEEIFGKILHLLAKCERISYRDRRIYSL